MKRGQIQGVEERGGLGLGLHGFCHGESCMWLPWQRVCVCVRCQGSPSEGTAADSGSPAAFLLSPRAETHTLTLTDTRAPARKLYILSDYNNKHTRKCVTT